MTSDRHFADDPHEEAAGWAARLAEEPDTAADRAGFEAWLEADPLNIARMEDIVRGWEAVEVYATADPIIELRQAALASARASALEQTRGWHSTSWRAVLAAASLVMAIMGGGLWWSLQPTEYRTGIGERRVVTLADGSTVSLDAGTVVDVAFARGERRLSVEQGRAKFVVTKDPLRPFSVQVGAKLVVATGTAFSVERLENSVNVILYEGHVALLDAIGDKSRPVVLRSPGLGNRQQLLAPEQQVTLPIDQAPTWDSNPKQFEVVTITRADPVRSLAWENGLLIFNDELLPAVVERINRYAERPLRIGDAGARRMRVSGVFRAGDTAALTQGLEAALHARVVQEPNATAVFAGS